MSLSDAIKRIRALHPDPFVTPLIAPQTETKIFTVQDSVPISFSMISPKEAGWYVVEARKINGKFAPPLHDPSPASKWEIDEFAKSLPSFVVVAVHKIEQSDQSHYQPWLCVPYNTGDAEQRGWKNSEPKVLHLVHGTNLLDIVIARNMAGTLLFDGVVYHLLSESYAGKVPQTAKDLLNKYLSPHPETQKRIREQADFMGAQVINVNEGYDLEVTWEYNGATFTSRLKSSGRVVSAGICLDGSDHEHTMATIIATMEDARRLHRPDVNEEFYL